MNMGKGNHRATEAQRGEREGKRKLPEGWEVKKLGEVCKYEKEPAKGESLPYVGLENIESNTGTFWGSLDPVKVKSLTFQFDESHILYGRLRPYLQKIITPNFHGHCSTEIFPIKPFPSVDRRFLFYWLISDSVGKRVNSTCTGARMPRADMNAVLEFDIPLPPLSEQKRIVAILDEAFAVIGKARENAEKNLDNAREIFESGLSGIFSDLATKHGNFKLEDVVEKECTLSYGIVQPGDDFCNGLPIVRPTDLIVKHIKLDGLKRINPKLAETYQRTTLTGNEILLCVRGSTGTVAISTKELAGSNVTRGIVPICFDSRKVLLDFGYYLFNSPFIQKQIKEKTYGTALMQINIADLRKIDIIAPPLLEQRRIVTELDALSAQTAKLETVYRKKIADLDELKASILERAFRGEL